jgi:hypothetical protein
MTGLAKRAAHIKIATTFMIPYARSRAQAGQAKLTEVIKAGGFSQVRRAAETPLNMILEARR